MSASDLAERLRGAQRGARPIPPLSESDPGLTVDEAYAVQRSGCAQRLLTGERVVGRKVGLTSAAMQRMLGVGEPDFGYLLDSMVLDSGATIPLRELISPRVEAEIAFVLGRGLRGPDVGVNEVLAATSEVAPALEVIDSRVADWRITLADTIADNASSALVVLGEPRPLDGLDLTAVEMTMVSGDHEVSGRGEAVLGHPAAGVAWLVNALARYDEELAKGDVVLPGALAGALVVRHGDVARAEFDVLGEVIARFDRGPRDA